MIPFERNPNHPRFRAASPEWREAGNHWDAPRDPAAAMQEVPRTSRGSWLIGPVFLLSIAAAMRLVFAGPDELFLVFFAVLLTVGVLWILVSSLFPASADRTCPSCQRKGLERIDPAATHGLKCRFCSWSDADASGFLHAEEDGPLEDIVLRERRRDTRF